jgi:hypothetical protein
VLILAVVVFFFLYQVNHPQAEIDTKSVIGKLLALLILFGSLFIVNFIVKKNGLSKDSSYTILFYFLFHLFIPDIFGNLNLLLANFFVLLAFRRLISLHSLKSAKEKVFDASLWIFIAALFHFWSILFIVLVFISILFHVARDYRNWLLPFIAGFAAVVAFLMFALIFDKTRIGHTLASTEIYIKIDYFANNYQNLALSIYVAIAVFFLASLLLTLSNRPLVLHTSYKKIIMMFLTAVIIYIISPAKSNELIIFTAAPLAMMATSHIEVTPAQWQKEVILGIAIACSLITFFTQL